MRRLNRISQQVFIVHAPSPVHLLGVCAALSAAQDQLTERAIIGRPYSDPLGSVKGAPHEFPPHLSLRKSSSSPSRCVHHRYQDYSQYQRSLSSSVSVGGQLIGGHKRSQNNFKLHGGEEKIRWQHLESDHTANSIIWFISVRGILSINRVERKEGKFQCLKHNHY